MWVAAIFLYVEEGVDFVLEGCVVGEHFGYFFNGDLNFGARSPVTGDEDGGEGALSEGGFPRYVVFGVEVCYGPRGFV